MAVKIRLARFGRKKKPVYRVVVANALAPRDGAFLEIVGTYNPLLAKEDPKRVVLDMDKIEHWQKVGAQPTEVVKRLLKTRTSAA